MTGFPCQAEFTLFDPDNFVTTIDEKVLLTIPANTSFATEADNGTMIDFLAASPGETQRWTVRAKLTACAAVNITGDVALSALYMPFGPTL